MKNNNYPYYAIEVANRGYTHIRKVLSNTTTLPTNCIAYKNVEEAQKAANELGYQIEKIGSCYEIL